MDILSFYRSFLSDNHVVEKEGTNALIIEGQSGVPITVGKKTLVLPTEEVTRKYNDIADEVQVFHPLSENTLRKDSAVFNFLKRLTRTALTVELEQLFTDLVNYTHNVELSKSANKKQREIIKHFVDIDDKTVENIENLLSKVDPNGENKIIDFTVVRGAELEGTKYSRVCYLHLPLYHELHGENATRPFGVKLRKKDVTLLIELHKVVFGDLLSNYDGKNATVSAYGTVDLHAPNFDAIATSFHRVKEAYRKIIEVFKKQFTQYPYMGGEWYEHMDKIQKYRALMPAFPGNDGEASAAEDSKRKTLPAAPKTRVTPLGTVKELPKVEVKENINEPMSYSEVLRLREQRIEENAKRQRERGYSYSRDDYDDIDDGYRRNRWENRRRGRADEIDVSDIDENYRNNSDGYRSRHVGRGMGDDIYYRREGASRYSGRGGYNSGRVRQRY